MLLNISLIFQDVKLIVSNLKCSKKKDLSPAAVFKEKRLLSIKKMDAEEKSALNEVLLANKAVQLHVVNDFCHHFIPPSLPTRLTSIYNRDFAEKTREEVWAECHRLKEELMVTREQALEAERLTVHQRKSHFFLRYGITNESKCINKGLTLLKKANLHPGFTFGKAGFVIYLKQAGLAATPDGYFTCNCHGRGVIEAKYVFSHQNEHLADVAQKKRDFFLKYDSDSSEFSFRSKQHPYSYQT